MSGEHSGGEERDDSDSPFDEGSDRLSPDPSDRQYGVYRCVDCENVVLTMRDPDGAMTCHGDEMEKVTDYSMEVRPPELRQVLLDAFGLPKAGLDICLCVIGEGPVSPATVADRLDYDESTIRTYLNELVNLGLLEKSQLNRESGGFVNVYHSIGLAEMREETLVGFYVWAGEAAALIEEANLTKEDYAGEDYAAGLAEVFWEQFSE